MIGHHLLSDALVQHVLVLLLGSAYQYKRWGVYNGVTSCSGGERSKWRVGHSYYRKTNVISDSPQ